MRARPGDAVAAEPRIYAYSQRPLLLPLAAARPSEAPEPAGAPARWRPSAVPRVQYESGPPVDARLVFIEATPQDNAGLPWIPAPARWSVIDWALTQDPAWNPAGGFWALFVPPPPDGRRQVLRFNGSALPIVWLANPPASTDAARAPRLDLDRTALRALGGLLEAIAADPLQAWRVRILTDRLRATELWATPPSSPSDPVLGALADLLEARWRSAIGVIERDDPVLGAEFVARLTAVVRLPSGVAVPIWPPDDSSLAVVRSALLAPTGSKATRIQAVRAWLASVPPAVAWMVDDNESDAPGSAAPLRRALVTIANLTSEPVVSSTAPAGKPALNAVRIPSHSSERLTCPVELQPGSGVVSVIARAGGWTTTLTAGAGARRVEPPGLLMGPLLPRWDMPSLLRGAPSAPDAREACIAMLQRSATEPTRWQVYVECSGAAARDEVTLWFGPYNGASVVSSVGPGVAQSPAVQREGARWWSMVQVPESALRPDGRLLIGVMRRAASGAVWSWPRPMAPGQTEPARAAVDLSRWGSLIEPVREDQGAVAR